VAEYDLFDIIHTTRAMRRLKPDPVPDELIYTILEAGLCAPSGGNRQPARFLVVKDRAVKEQIQPYYLRAYEELVGPLYAASKPPPNMTGDAYARQQSAVAHLSEHLHEAPVWIVPCADPRDELLSRAYSSDRVPPHQKGASIYPAVENMLLAARAVGLGAVLTTRHLVFQKEVEAILGLPEGVESYAIVPIGYPLGQFGPVRRADVNEVIYLDHWGSAHPPLTPASQPAAISA
jgi:nitroreductase